MAKSTTNQVHRIESGEESPRRWNRPLRRPSDTFPTAPISHLWGNGARNALVVSDEEDRAHYSQEEDEGELNFSLPSPNHVQNRITDDSMSSSSSDESKRVEIIGGTYKGSRGTFVRKTDKRIVIQMDDGSQRRLAPQNVRFLDLSTSDFPRCPTKAREAPAATTSATFLPGSTVRIVRGSYCGQTATVSHQTAQRVAVRIINDVSLKIRHFHPSTVVAVDGDPDGPSSTCFTESNGILNTRLRRSPRGHPSSPRDVTPEEQQPLELLHHILGLREDCVSLIAPGRVAQCQRTLAFAIFGHRVRTLQFSCSSSVASSIPVTSIEPDGSKYELLSVKLQKPTSFESTRCRQIQAQYVLTQAGRHMNHNIPTIHLQEELERYAHFGRLSTGKVVARLELLQSTAYMHNKKPVICTDLTVDEFEEIPEVAHEGCGFMPVQLVHRLFGSGIVGQRTFALQVRILAPKLGLFKGMLVVKPGIQRIQLPSSMRKVEPAAVDASGTEANRVHLLVNGKFPSNVNALYLPKLFRGDLPPKSFTPKVLNDMIIRLWQDWPIPVEVIDQYVEESQVTRGRGLEHTCLVGLADPTDGIPAGMVFITGIHCQQAPIQDTIFVTRYPCTEAATDGHMLPVLRDRPSNSMDEVTWKWINTLPFGGILFGNPASASEEPLPCRIANGDLDGDLYFVCWNTEIVSHCMARRSVGVSPTTRTVAAASTPIANPNWLRQGQECMSDVERLSNLSALISKLYKHWKLKDNTAGDCTHFGRAYKSALDIGKHGGFVFLPPYLWDALPSSLHAFLTTNPH